MSGIVFGFFSLAVILMKSMLYYIQEANKSIFPNTKKLKKRAWNLGIISIFSFAAAFFLLINEL